MINVAIYIISFAILITSIRIFIGPTVWDRVLGLNLMLTKILMLIVLYGAIYNKSYLLDIALTYAIIGFVSTLFIAQFLKGKGKL